MSIGLQLKMAYAICIGVVDEGRVVWVVRTHNKYKRMVSKTVIHSSATVILRWLIFSPCYRFFMNCLTLFLVIISLALTRDWIHIDNVSCDRPWNVVFCEKKHENVIIVKPLLQILTEVICATKNTLTSMHL